MILSGASVEVTGIDRSMTESTVTLTATLGSGLDQDYTLMMVRDGLGWKISDVEADYLSTVDDSSSLDESELDDSDALDEETTDQDVSPQGETDSSQDGLDGDSADASVDDSTNADASDTPDQGSQDTTPAEGTNE